MPTYTRDRERNYTRTSYDRYDNTTYSRKYYSNTSTAYEIPMTYPERVKTPVSRPAQKPETNAKKGKRLTASQVGIIKMCGILLFAFALCCTVVYRYAVILECNQEIKELEKMCETIMAENQAMQGRIDRSLEVGEIERVAREELGMMKPEAYQIFYIDMDMQDMGSTGSAKAGQSSGALVGVPGTLVNAFRVLK